MHPLGMDAETVPLLNGEAGDSTVECERSEQSVRSEPLALSWIKRSHWVISPSEVGSFM